MAIQTWYERRGHPGLADQLACDDPDGPAVIDWLDQHASPHIKERLQDPENTFDVNVLDTIDRGDPDTVAELRSSYSTRSIEPREAVVFYRGVVLTVQRQSRTSTFYESMALAGFTGMAFGGMAGLFSTLLWPSMVEGVADFGERLDRILGLMPYTGAGFALMGALVGALFVYLMNRPTDDPRIRAIHDEPEPVFQTLSEADELGIKKSGMRRLLNWVERNGAERLIETEAATVLATGSEYVLYEPNDSKLRCFERSSHLQAVMKHEHSSDDFAALEAVI